MRFRQVGGKLVVEAPAKLNLFLEILGKREDGYHELETLMVVVDLFDTLIFTEENSNAIRLRCSQAGIRLPLPAPSGIARTSSDAAEDAIPTGPENLVYKAAQ